VSTTVVVELPVLPGARYCRDFPVRSIWAPVGLKSSTYLLV